jgi:hypothetical protein
LDIIDYKLENHITTDELKRNLTDESFWK